MNWPYSIVQVNTACELFLFATLAVKHKNTDKTNVIFNKQITF